MLLGTVWGPQADYGYEVATVKKSDSSARGSRINPGPQGGLRTTNTNLMSLITFAWDVRDYQVLDAPGWVKSDPFDVSFTPDKAEKMPPPGSPLVEIQTMMDRQRSRLRAVLRDRFGLVLRQETRQLPVYGLVAAKGGHKLRPPSAGKGPSMNGGNGSLTGYGVNIKMLTDVLGRTLQRPVVDETGVAGTFDMKLEWKPDVAPPGPKDDSAELDGSSIFTALQEQLGLRLEAKKGPVTIYVVEKVGHPTDN